MLVRTRTLLAGTSLALGIAAASPSPADVILPSSAFSSGANGALFRSNVRVLNTGAEAASVVPVLYDQATGETFTRPAITIPPRQQVRWDNVLSTLVGRSAPSFGPIRLRTSDAATFPGVSGTTDTDLWLEFTADRPVLSFASVIHNVSGDPFAVVAVRDTPPPASQDPTSEQLKAYVATFPPMPRETVDLLRFLDAPGQLTFASGTPRNDLEYTLFDTSYMEGETAGFDVFCPVDPADPFPGAGRVNLVRCVSNPALDVDYGGARGDRVILGVGENPSPFFRRPGDGIDEDDAVLQSFDFVNGRIQLARLPSDYRLVCASAADGAATEGWYLLYTKGFAGSGELDLIAFVYPCRDLAVDAPPANPDLFCNLDRSLSLTNPAPFVFAQPPAPTPTVSSGIAQLGSRGKEIVGGLTADAEGNVYLFGSGDGNLDGGADPDNEMFLVKVRPDGTRAWATELGTMNGALLFDAVADSTCLYAVGRTFGSLPGFTNQGGWDGVIVKVRLADGAIVDTDQWGNPGIDGYGAVTLDDAGNLYVSGAGSLPGAGWLVVGGWFANPPNGADGFPALYGDLGRSAPTRLEPQVIGAPGRKADWILDHDVDRDLEPLAAVQLGTAGEDRGYLRLQGGRLFVGGMTEGSLVSASQGSFDAFALELDPGSLAIVPARR